MVAQGNVGLAFGLVIGAGLSTTIGATFALCAKLSDKRLLASSLGVSAGVMMYVSFVEIFATKSVSGFEDTGMSTGKSYLFATLSFFGGVLMTVLLDKLVHLLGHSDDHDFPATSGPSLNQRSHAADVIKRSDSSKTALSLRTYKVADSESSRSSSLSLPVGLMGPYKEEGPATTDKSTQERSATERGVQEKLTKERGAETEEDHATLLGLAPAPQSSPSVPPRSRSEPPVDLAVVLVVPALDDGSLKDDTVLHDGSLKESVPLNIADGTPLIEDVPDNKGTPVINGVPHNKGAPHINDVAHVDVSHVDVLLHDAPCNGDGGGPPTPALLATSPSLEVERGTPIPYPTPVEGYLLPSRRHALHDSLPIPSPRRLHHLMAHDDDDMLCDTRSHPVAHDMLCDKTTAATNSAARSPNVAQRAALCGPPHSGASGVHAPGNVPSQAMHRSCATLAPLEGPDCDMPPGDDKNPQGSMCDLASGSGSTQGSSSSSSGGGSGSSSSSRGGGSSSSSRGSGSSHLSRGSRGGRGLHSSRGCADPLANPHDCSLGNDARPAGGVVDGSAKAGGREHRGCSRDGAWHVGPMEWEGGGDQEGSLRGVDARIDFSSDDAVDDMRAAGTSLLIEGSTRQRVDGPVGTRARAGGTSGRRRGGSLSSDYDDLRDRKELHRMGLMTALAVSIHNFPEGLATFVAALADSRLGATIAVAIAVHNIPEGICVAMPVYYATGSRWKGFLWSVLIGVSEPLGALLGYAVLANHFSDLVFGVLFGGVAGMMVYISASELLPTARKYDPEDKYVSICFVLGMAVIATSLVLFAL